MSEDGEKLLDNIRGESRGRSSKESRDESFQTIDENQPASLKSKVVLSICIFVVAIALLLHYLKPKEEDAFQENVVNLDEKPSVVNEEELGYIKDDSDVMIYLKKIQARPKNKGEPCDLDKSAPDLFYQIFWNENKIYESEIKEDSLIAEWIPLGMSVKDSILKGRLNVDQAIDLPIVEFDRSNNEGSDILIKVFDSDTLNSDDELGEVQIKLAQLKFGDNKVDLAQRENLGLVEIDIRVIDNALATDEKIQAIMRGQ